MKFSALDRLARERGIAASAIDEAIESDSPKTALVALLAPEKSGPASQPDVQAEQEPGLKAEDLRRMKFSALEQLAHERGIAAAAIDAALNSEDQPKAALIGLLTAVPRQREEEQPSSEAGAGAESSGDDEACSSSGDTTETDSSETDRVSEKFSWPTGDDKSPKAESRPEVQSEATPENTLCLTLFREAEALQTGHTGAQFSDEAHEALGGAAKFSFHFIKSTITKKLLYTLACMQGRRSCSWTASAWSTLAAHTGRAAMTG